MDEDSVVLPLWLGVLIITSIPMIMLGSMVQDAKARAKLVAELRTEPVTLLLGISFCLAWIAWPLGVYFDIPHNGWILAYAIVAPLVTMALRKKPL